VSAALSEVVDELRSLADRVGRQVQFMEVCGTHTVAVFRHGIRTLLPASVRLISGPGCPVCVTAQRYIDAAGRLASRPEVILATYGDMLRVPGRDGSLQTLRAAGADVRVITSARLALELARRNPRREVVFFAVGFETTAPATAATLLEAQRLGVPNLSMLVAHKLIVPAMLQLLAPPADGSAAGVPLDGFLCPGHVSVIIGSQAYRPIVERHATGCVVAGFEPGQILRGLLHLLRQVARGRPALENVYSQVVRPAGNPTARALLARVFVEADADWRGLGTIPASGLELAPHYRAFDALERFGLKLGEDHEEPGCRCGQVLTGSITPPDCTLFGRRCTPATPIGPCMVSSEGTCAAYYRYATQQPTAVECAP